jgi:hypothetical protein
VSPFILLSSLSFPFCLSLRSLTMSQNPRKLRETRRTHFISHGFWWAHHLHSPTRQWLSSSDQGFFPCLSQIPLPFCCSRGFEARGELADGVTKSFSTSGMS